MKLGTLKLEGRWRNPQYNPPYSGGGGGGGGSNTDYGPDIRDWMAVASDNAEVVANGGVLYLPTDRTYYGGDLGDCRNNLGSGGYNRPFNAGLANNGWLRLAPEPGGGRITVDLSPTANGFALSDADNGGALRAGAPDAGNPKKAYGEASFRIVFDGFDWQNGRVWFNGSDRLRFFDNTGTFPIAEWKSQYDAATTFEGYSVLTTPPNSSPYNDTILDSTSLKGNATATPFRFEQDGNSAHRASNIWLYNVDSFETGDDGIYMGDTDDFQIVGVRAWHNRGGSRGGGGLMAVIFHNDILQTSAFSVNPLIHHSVLAGHIQTGTEFGSLSGIDVDDVWQCDSDGNGWSFGDPGNDATGSVTNYIWFGNGQDFGPTPVGDSLHFTRDGGGEWNEGLEIGFSSGPTIYTGGGLAGVSYSVPAGVTMTGGVLDDVVGQVIQNSNNPALQYRATNNDAATVFSGTYD